jgi:SAM-dependent methyltransferase
MDVARSHRSLTLVEKQAYYEGSAMPPALARRYWRELGIGARVVLDAGCGIGEFGRYKPLPGIVVHGVDADSGAVSRASAWEDARCVDVDTELLPYADGVFSGALAKDIFEHVQAPGALARELHRVMQPGAVLVASVVMARPKRVWADYTHVRGFTRESAVMLLADAGFTVEAVWRMGPVPLSQRLHFIDAVPHLLRVRPFDAWWGASWELRARR